MHAGSLLPKLSLGTLPQSLYSLAAKSADLICRTGRHIPSREVTSLFYVCNKSELPTETLCVSPWMFLNFFPSTSALRKTNMSEAL